MTYPLLAIGVDYRRISEIKSLGFTAARCFQSEATNGVVGPEEFVALCRDAGLEAMGRTIDCTWWTAKPDEPQIWKIVTQESLQYDVSKIRDYVARGSIPICYVPGHYQDKHVQQVAACGTEVMLGSYARLPGYNYPPQFTLWRPTCLTGELCCVALNCEHGSPELFRWDLFATLAAGAKAIAIYKPHAIAKAIDMLPHKSEMANSWFSFLDFVNDNDRLIRSGVRTVQSAGSEMYDPYDVKNDKGQVVCTVPPQPKDQLVTWSLGYERCSVRVNGDEIETRSWRGI